MSIDKNTRTQIADALLCELQGRPADVPVEIASPDSWYRLGQVEKSALLQIQNWREDADLRIAFPQHEAYSRQRLRALLERLQS